MILEQLDTIMSFIVKDKLNELFSSRSPWLTTFSLIWSRASFFCQLLTINSCPRPFHFLPIRRPWMAPSYAPYQLHQLLFDWPVPRRPSSAQYDVFRVVRLATASTIDRLTLTKRPTCCVTYTYHRHRSTNRWRIVAVSRWVIQEILAYSYRTQYDVQFYKLRTTKAIYS